MQFHVHLKLNFIIVAIFPMKKKVISNKPYCEAQFMAIESDIEQVFSKSLFESIIICPPEELVVSGNNNVVVVSYEK